jgi:hypothetical protein
MHKQDNSGEAATTKAWVLIAVGIAIAMIKWNLIGGESGI